MDSNMDAVFARRKRYGYNTGFYGHNMTIFGTFNPKVELSKKYDPERRANPEQPTSVGIQDTHIIRHKWFILPDQ
ncbi:hypothetical protein GCM10008985_19520 [Halococcus dombrowskii]|uniref:Uncharacterized protein n=1 Tax=Halococcus dombrowskii TaxID=179637 RepID=A0AAV3SHJ2_HALDO